MTHYDIVIAGGGMVGSTLALALETLAKGRLSVAVVEPFRAGDDHPGFDARSIALSYGSVQLLKSFSLWDELQPFTVPIREIHVSDRGHAGMTQLSAAHYGISALGYVAELADIGRIYHRKLQASAGDFFCPDTVDKIERCPDKNIIILSSGRQISCSLLVAADGTASGCCRQLGLTERCHDVHQVAVIANIVTAEPHHHRAFERFTAHGPLALLPMSDGRMSLVWCMSPQQAGDVMQLSETAFLQRLQTMFGWRLGAMQKAGARTAYPLQIRQKNRPVSHRFVAVGNAAQTLHPVAGQGFNLGIRDVATLAELLAEQCNETDHAVSEVNSAVSEVNGVLSEVNSATCGGKDVGSFSFLAQYRQRREQDCLSTIDLTSHLVALFSDNRLPLVMARQAGLMVMDTCSAPAMPFLLRTLGLVKR